jgi:hypothetical protein
VHQKDVLLELLLEFELLVAHQTLVFADVVVAFQVGVEERFAFELFVAEVAFEGVDFAVDSFVGAELLFGLEVFRADFTDEGLAGVLRFNMSAEHSFLFEDGPAVDTRELLAYDVDYERSLVFREVWGYVMESLVFLQVALLTELIQTDGTLIAEFIITVVQIDV